MAKKKATNGATKSALVYLVLDRSGSMAPIQGATIEGVNHFIRETTAADEGALFSMIQFDHQIKRHLQGVPIATVKPLDGRSYQIGGNTALLDAVGTAIYDVDHMDVKPAKTVVVVMTDGLENQSHEYTREAVKALVSARESEGWQFLFLGANLDAFSEAGAIGMANAATTSATWKQTARGTQAAYMTTSSGVGSFLRGHTMTASVTQDAYDSTLASLGGDAGSTTPTLDTTTTTGKVPLTAAKRVARKR